MWLLAFAYFERFCEGLDANCILSAPFAREIVSQLAKWLQAFSLKTFFALS